VKIISVINVSPMAIVLISKVLNNFVTKLKVVSNASKLKIVWAIIQAFATKTLASNAQKIVLHALLKEKNQGIISLIVLNVRLAIH